MPNERGCFYKAEPAHPIRYKRNVAHVTIVRVFDVWKDTPEFATVEYMDSGGFGDISKPIKIYGRKNKTHYITFDGKRYDIDPTNPAAQPVRLREIAY